MSSTRQRSAKVEREGWIVPAQYCDTEEGETPSSFAICDLLLLLSSISRRRLSEIFSYICVCDNSRSIFMTLSLARCFLLFSIT